MYRHTFDRNGLCQHIASSAGHRRDNRRVLSGQGVEQRAFTRIGLPSNHQCHAVSQQSALACFDAQQTGFFLHGPQLSGDIGLGYKVDVFFRKIQTGFHQHTHPQ